MSRVDELSPDRRAVLSLILRRQKSYAEIASALQIDEDEVRERAHGAIEELAGEPADELERSERERIGDYLLAQQSAEERLITYDELDGSPAASAFARAAADELAAISDATLPEIPDAEDGARPRSPRRAAVPPPSPKPQRAKAPRKPRGGPRERPPAEPEVPRAPRPARESGRPPLPSSRLGGAILLGLIVVGAIVAIVLVSTSGGGSPAPKSQSSAAVGNTGATGTTGTAQVRLNQQLKLTPPNGGSAVGAAAVLSQSGRYVLALAAEHLPASEGFYYAAWLYNSPSEAYPLGKAPSVSSNGQLKPVAQALPENASHFHQLIITKETSEHPSSPGETVLVGPFSLH